MLSDTDIKRNQFFASKGYGNLCNSFKAGEDPYERTETKGTGTSKI
jgi:hypothetical protein